MNKRSEFCILISLFCKYSLKLVDITNTNLNIMNINFKNIQCILSIC
jgi:hypothetical protein